MMPRLPTGAMAPGNGPIAAGISRDRRNEVPTDRVSRSYGAEMRGMPLPEWHALQAPDDAELTGICNSPLASRMRMSAPARLEFDPL
jgi:hypothetical protein